MNPIEQAAERYWNHRAGCLLCIEVDDVFCGEGKRLRDELRRVQREST